MGFGRIPPILYTCTSVLSFGPRKEGCDNMLDTKEALAILNCSGDLVLGNLFC